MASAVSPRRRGRRPTGKSPEAHQGIRGAAPQVTATSFDTLPHSTGLAITGGNAFPASQTRASLERTSSNRLIAKRTTTFHVVLCLYRSSSTC